MLSPLGSLRIFLAVFAVVAVLWGSVPRALLAQFEVQPVFRTPPSPDGNVDSCAAWVPSEGGEPLLFVTEKDGDRIQVWRARDGKPYAPKPAIGGTIDGSLPGELNRPNGVWVLYHVPHASGFADVLVVTDQQNQRVQIFRLPELEYFGEFGTGEVGKGYGIAWHQDGTDTFVWITDTQPPALFPGKIKKYRLRPAADGLGADLLLGVGSSSGVPPLSSVESMVADPANDRLHVCGDEGGRLNWIFRLDGAYTGVAYGDAQFEHDQEGINLYETGGDHGYLVVSDQYTSGRNQFEVFDRKTLASLGNFQSPAGGPLVTVNTDGAYLEQRGFPGFPNGAFYAVHDDREVHVYDWTDIAESMGLEIVALDRPFSTETPEGGKPTRALLWFHDGSWWGALPREGTLVVSRLEDGTFLPREAIGPLDGTLETGAGEPAAPGLGASDRGASLWASGPHLAVLLSGEAASIRRFVYEPALRRYAPTGLAATVPDLDGPLAALMVEPAVDGSPHRGWVAWVADGELRVRWSGGDLSAWPGASASLGSAAPVLPRWVRLGESVGLLWAETEALRFRIHEDAQPPEVWSDAETVATGSFEALWAALSGERVIALGAGSDAVGRIWERSAAGIWNEKGQVGEAREPALVLDLARARAHLFSVSETGGHRLVKHREAEISDLVFGPESLVAGWPGVEQEDVLVPFALPSAAPEIVAVSLGSDGRGYFARVTLPAGPDLLAPISLQHDPVPGSTDVPEGATVSFRLTDHGAGVDRAQIRLLVDGAAVAPRIRGVPRNYLVAHDLPAGLGGQVRVRIEAKDRAPSPNAMAPFEYSFRIDSGAPRFRRGDASGDGELDIVDPVRILLFLFVVGAEPGCLRSADSDSSGAVDVSDAIFVLRHLFLAGEAPEDPFPGCGSGPVDETLSCEAYTACP